MIKGQAQFNSLHRGQCLAASLPASDPLNLAWVGVYPLDLSRTTTVELLRNRQQPIPMPSVRAYRIRVVEVPQVLIEEDASIAEGDLTNRVDEFAFGDEDLMQKLERLGVSTADLALPYKSDYPI